MTEHREPQLNIHRVNGELWAETTGPNGSRRKFPIYSLADLHDELDKQTAEIERKNRIEATTRHTAIYCDAATKHGPAFAQRTIGGKIPSGYFFSQQSAEAAKQNSQNSHNTTKSAKPHIPTSREIGL